MGEREGERDERHEPTNKQTNQMKGGREERGGGEGGRR
jgi:hypothetical protein